MPNYWKKRLRNYVEEKIERQKKAVQARRDAVIAERDRQRRETAYYRSAPFVPKVATRYDSPQKTRYPHYAERVAHQQNYYMPRNSAEFNEFMAHREVVGEHRFYSGYDDPPSVRDYHRYPPAPSAIYPPVHQWGSTPYYQQYDSPHRDIYRPSPAELMRAGGYTPSITNKQEMRSRQH